MLQHSFCKPATPVNNPEWSFSGLKREMHLRRTQHELYYRELYVATVGCMRKRIKLTTATYGPATSTGGFMFASLGSFAFYAENYHMAQIADRNTASAVPNLPIQGARATAAQLCTKYQVSRTTWWRWSQSPGFPAPMRFGRSVRWSAEAVDSFLTKQEG